MSECRNISKLGQLREYLGRGMELSDFYVRFQPIYHRDGRLYGFESLLRFGNPVLGEISPELLVPVMEAVSGTKSVEDMVIKETMLLLKQLHRIDPAVKGSLNISPGQLDGQAKRDELFFRIISQAEEIGIPKRNLVLEITEYCYMEKDATASFAQTAQNHGFGVGIDDFGAGAATLEMVEHVTKDLVKIDRAFMENRSSNDYYETLCFLVEQSREKNFQICQEGVENSQQLDLCRELEIDLIQGFYYSRAVDADSLLAMAGQSAAAQKEQVQSKEVS